MAKENKFEKFSDSIIDLLGGKSNITNMTYCMSRLRFSVTDKSLVQVDEIEAFDCVIGTQWSGDQFQIIIGQSVPDAYELIAKKTGLGEVEARETTKKKFSFGAILDAISGSIVPMIPILITCGFIKVIVIVGEMAGVLAPGSATYTVLSFAGDAGFYFFPIYVGYSSANKFGANPLLGMLLGAILIHPSFIEAVNNGDQLSIFGLPIPDYSYAASIFPVLLSTAVMAPIQRFIGKHSPEAARVVIEPFFTILIMLPLSLCLLAPIGQVAGGYLATSIMWFYDKTGFLGVALLSSLWPLIVLTGMHTAFVPYVIQAVGNGLGDSIVWPAGIIAAANQGMAALAVAVKTKNTKIKGLGISTGVTALASSVFEPALFGLTFRYRTPLYASAIGSFIGAAIAGFGHATAYAMTGTTSLTAIAVFVAPDMAPFWFMIIGTVVGMISTFILTLIMYSDKDLERG